MIKLKVIGGSCNDLNIFYHYDVFNKMLTSNVLKMAFEVNGHIYDKCYYLTDNI